MGGPHDDAAFEERQARACTPDQWYCERCEKHSWNEDLSTERDDGIAGACPYCLRTDKLIEDDGDPTPYEIGDTTGGNRTEELHREAWRQKYDR